MLKEETKAVRTIRPFARPRLIDPAYTEDEIASLFAAIRRFGPVRQMLSIYAEEMAGQQPDVIPDPCFRGELASEGLCFDPAIEGAFYNSRFLQLARDYRRASYALPRQLAFNITAPSLNSDPGHVDAPAFRGLWHVNTPPWLLGIMAQSRLFEAYAVKMVQITGWLWRGQYGGFTYWPDGPESDPCRISAPTWNRAILAENQYMFHRAESLLPPGSSTGLAGMQYHSKLHADPEDDDGWIISTGENVIARRSTEELRFMIHWSCIVFDDKAEVTKYFDHEDDLNVEKVIAIFQDDLAKKGFDLATSSDPLEDPRFRDRLHQAYAVGGPMRYPPEAPWAVG